MFDILFTNALIVTMDRDSRVINNGYLGVTGKNISYIGDTRPNEAVKREISCNGNIIMPGLVNTHAHTAMTLLRALEDKCSLNDWLFKHIFPLENKLDERAVMCGFTLGIAEMLASGVTSMCDMYYFEDKAMFRCGEIGFRGLFSNAIISLSPSYTFETDRSYTELVSMMNMCSSFGGLVRPMAAIHCERTSQPNVWIKAVEFAKQNKLMMNIHLSEAKEDFDNCVKECGKTPTERLSEYDVFDVPTVAAHCCHLTDGDIKILADKGVSVSHNAISNLKLASGICPIKHLIDAGVNVSLGTDGCSSNDSLDMFEEMKTATLLAKYLNNDAAAFSAFDAVTLATVNGARALGLDGVIGRLSVGYEADIIMLDVSGPHMHPLRDPYRNIVYAARGSDVALTMVQGKVLYESGNYTTIDIGKVYDELDSYALPLLNKQ